MWSLFKRLLPLHFGGFAYFLFFIQFYYLYQVAVYNALGGFSFTWSTFGCIFLSMATVMFFYQVISAASSQKPRLHFIVSMIYLVCYGLLIAYHFGARELLDWSVVVDNAQNVFSIEALGVMLKSLDMGGIFYIVLFVGLFTFFEFKKKVLTKGMQARPLWIKFVLGMLIYLIFLLAPIASFDPYVNFFRSIYHYYHPSVNILPQLPEGDHPFLTDASSFYHSHFSRGEKPYVFIIIVESFDASAIGLLDKDGKPYTPFLNSLRQQGIYVNRFYGDSVLTPKGHLAVLFSIIPSITGKVFTKFAQLPLKSIATVFDDNGYDTSFFLAHHDPNFDNTYSFLTQRGFHHFELVDHFTTSADMKQASPWGVPDSIFYHRFFDYFDAVAKHHPGEPQFFSLATIANHFPFEIARYASGNILPKKSGLFTQPSQWIRANYYSSIRLTDAGMAVFFQELEKRHISDKSLVIITGDHAFPLGEHGNYHLEAGYHEESFRIPLYIIWKGTISPKMMPGPYCQLDIAPTIVDILHLKTGLIQFQGHSIFDPTSYPIFQIQPYGKHLSVIRFPFKYRFYDKTQQEYVYDLVSDPMETTNIIRTLPQAKLDLFRADLKRIYLNQYAIEHQLFYP